MHQERHSGFNSPEERDCLTCGMDRLRQLVFFAFNTLCPVIHGCRSRGTDKEPVFVIREYIIILVHNCFQRIERVASCNTDTVISLIMLFLFFINIKMSVVRSVWCREEISIFLLYVVSRFQRAASSNTLSITAIFSYFSWLCKYEVYRAVIHIYIYISETSISVISVFFSGVSQD